MLLKFSKSTGTIFVPVDFENFVGRKKKSCYDVYEK